MDMNVSPENLDTVCEGCLSTDRHLTAEVTDLHIKSLYFEIVNIAVENIHNAKLRLCVECKANIRKYFAFRTQVIEAHDILNKILLKSSQSNSLVAPQPNSTGAHQFHPLIETDAESARVLHVPLAFIKVEDAPDDAGDYFLDDGSSREGREEDFTLKSSQSNSLVAPQPDSTGAHQFHPLIETDAESAHVLHVPLAFKVEDAPDDAGDYFVDDGSNREGREEDFTAVLNPDLIAPNKLKLRVRNKNRSKKRQEEDFDASDEEPLKNKKSKKDREADGGRGKRTKKRKKGNDASPKIDRRKHPAPKKEKPPGVVDNQRVRNKLQRLNVAHGQLEMQVLSWEEVEAERQKALASITFTRHEYRCYDCALGFNHKFKLTNHLKKHDPSAGECVCSVCRVRCKDSHALCAHRRRHRVRWRCCECGATSSRADVAADHVAREHGAPAPTHVCRVCGHTAPSLAKLRNHMKNHGERQKCELCGKSFRDRSSLRTHLFIHAGSKEYACPRCDKRFLFKKAMEVHLVTHDAPAHLYCYECDLNFKNRMSFKQHMKYSLKHIDPAMLKYACALCDKKFMKASRLEEHNLAVHLKVTPISCTAPGCNFACSSRPVLRTHARMAHRGGRAVRNHVCHACGKAYMTKKTLEGHLRSHTGERPFKCAQCASTFGYEAALYNHKKLVHLNAKLGRARPAPPAPPVAPPAPPAPTAAPPAT